MKQNNNFICNFVSLYTGNIFTIYVTLEKYKLDFLYYIESTFHDTDVIDTEIIEIKI